MSLSKEEISRYSRQIILPEFGEKGQNLLKKSSVLVVGAGGLGAPLLMYLTAAGIGKIGIIDFDKVDKSNLHRQVLYGDSDIGKNKVEQALLKLKEINPHVNFEVYDQRLTSENALKFINDYEVIADGTDNFPSRYLVNDACVLLNKVNVFASVLQFEGQLSVFNYKNGPNYRDLFPNPPAPGMVPSCAEGGVLGVLPGILGSMQALEVIKVITGLGEVLSGKLLLIDSKGMNFRKINIQKDPENPINGNNPTIKELIDYEEFCGIKSDKIKSLDALELKKRLDEAGSIKLIDVRNSHEHEVSNLGGVLIPHDQIENNIDKIPREGDVVLYCRSGQRSLNSIKILEEKYGYTNLINLEGGILGWKNAIQPNLTVV